MDLHVGLELVELLFLAQLTVLAANLCFIRGRGGRALNDECFLVLFECIPETGKAKVNQVSRAEVFHDLLWVYLFPGCIQKGTGSTRRFKHAPVCP